MRRMFEFGVFTSVVTRKRVSLVLRMSTFIFLREIIFHFPSLYIYIYIYQFFKVNSTRRYATRSGVNRSCIVQERDTSNYNKYNALPTFERDESFENTSRIIHGRTTIAIKTTNDVGDERKYHIVEIATKESFSSF